MEFCTIKRIKEKNKKPLIILISGKARHGKDTVASLIGSELSSEGVRVLCVHYADYLKYICRQYYHWDGQKDERGRTLLQTTGETFRKKNPNFWVNNLMGLVNQVEDEYDVVIIPDVRYLNEISCWSNNYNCLSLRVVRKESDEEFQGGLTKEQLVHPSETELDDYRFDLFIINNGTIRDLEDKIHCEIMSEINIKRKNEKF